MAERNVTWVLLCWDLDDIEKIAQNIRLEF